ncbi:hypothetical protein ACOMHN_001057 [Nucella lapillus]
MTVAAAKWTSKIRPKIKEDDYEEEYAFLKDKFTVKDILRMFKISLRGTAEELGETKDEDGDKRLEIFLEMMRGAEQEPDGVKFPSHRPRSRNSSEILAHASDSDVLQDLFALSETVLEKKQMLVHPVVREAYRIILQYKALPNSTLKRLPKVIPRPKPTWNQLLQQKVLNFILKYYGPEKPRPNYPILPPRERPPPPPEPEPKGKKKRKGKNKKKKKHPLKPAQPFNMETWRKQNLPAASTRLLRPWFQPKPCFLPTPPTSPQPPTPPGEVPEPDSFFGYFVNNLGPGYLNKHSLSDNRKSIVISPAPMSSRRQLGGDAMLSPSSVRNMPSHSLTLTDVRSTGQVTAVSSDHSSRKDGFLSVS